MSLYALSAPPGRSRRQGVSLGATVAAVAMLFGLLAAPTAASAAGESLSVDLVQATGTAPWDDLDAGPDDSLVRTNDVISYNVALSQRGDLSGLNPYIELTAPKGTEVMSLPPYCESGSITPATLPAPKAPITGTSWESLPQQTVRCYLPARFISDNSEQNFPFEVRVRPEVPSGTKLEVSVTAAADNVTPAAPATAEAEAVAKARYDLSKNGLFEVPNTMNLTLASRTECGWGDPSRQCMWTNYTVMVSVPNGGKGNTPLSEFSFTDDLSTLAYYGVDMSDADTARYGTRLDRCATPANYVGVPYSKLGNPTTAVRDSGTVTCTQPGGPGTPVTVKVTNADTTAWTYPTKDQRGNDLPGTSAAVFAYNIRIQVPIEAVLKFGKAAPGGTQFTLPLNNSLKDFTGTDIAGNPIDPTANVPENDYRNSNLVVSMVGQAAKLFAAVPGTPGNVAAGVYEANKYWQGPAGIGGTWSGDGQIFPGADVYSALSLRNGTSPELTTDPLTIGICDSWDNSLLQLHAADYPTGAGNANMIGSGGKAVWIGGAVMPEGPGAATSVWVTDPSKLPKLTVKYSNAATGGPGFDCAGVTQWYDDPQDVPGNDATLAQSGIYSAVNLVRVVGEMPTAISASRALVNIGLRATDAVVPGTIVPNYISDMVIPRGDVSETDLAKARWTLSPYNKETNVGGRGDRLIGSTLISRINKEIKAADGKYTSNITEVTSGGQYTYRLTPTLNAGATVGTSPKVIIEDCLPAGQIIVSASMPYLTTTQPGSTLDCAGGTYLYWDLGSKASSDKLAPITYDVRISNIIDAGTYDNVARIDAVGDSSAAEKRTDVQQVRVVNPAGVKIEKSAASPQTEVNRDPAQQFNNQVQWDITSANIGNFPGVINADQIDLFPKNGLDPLAGTDFSKGASEFSGSLELASVTKEAGTKSEIWYSTVDQSLLKTDPRDLSNSTNGATQGLEPRIPNPATWSLTPPADMTKVTAVRVKHDGAFESADNFTYRLVFTPHGNATGDRYVNVTYAMATVLTASGGFVDFRNLGPIASEVSVIGGSIGDKVWFDSNGDGVQQAGEPPAPGMTVRLSGTDALGNSISLETKTKADGTYTFDNLHSSDATGYTVQFVKPDGEHFTERGVGDDRAVDSDARQTDGIVAGIVLAAGENRTDIDAGLVKPAIDLVKSADPKSGLRAGDKVTYTFTATNTGSMTLTDVALDERSFKNAAGTDLQLDAAPLVDTAKSTGTIAALAPGQVLVWTAEYTVTAVDVSVGDKLENTAEVQGTGVNPDSPIVTDEDDETVTLVPAAPAIQLVKSADPRSGLTVGSVVHYTFTATNTGDVTLTNIQLTEQEFKNAAGDRLTLDAAPVLDTAKSTGTLDSLAPGQILVWTAPYTVTEADVAVSGAIVNTAKVEGTPPGVTTPVTDEDDEKVYPAGVPGIDIVKFIDDDDANSAPGILVPAGHVAKFRYVVTNTGNTVLRDVKVVDDKGVKVSFPADFSGTLKPGEKVTGTGTGAIPAGEYKNIGTVTGTPVDEDGNPVLDQDGKPITSVTDEDPAHAFGAAAAFTLLKEVADANGAWHTGDDHPELPKGSTAVWRVTVKNTGNVPLENLVVTDKAIPSGSKTIAYLKVGEEASWQFESKVGDDKLENVVTASIDTPYCVSDCTTSSKAGYTVKTTSTVAITGAPGAWAAGGLGILLLIAGAGIAVARRRTRSAA